MWIKLNDIYVNCAAQTDGDAWSVAMAIGFIFENAGEIPENVDPDLDLDY